MNDRSSQRLLVMYILIGSLVVALFGRLYYLQIAAGPKYQQAALDNQSRDIVTPAVRGMILDDRGVPLAVNRTGLVVTVDNVALGKQADGGKAVLTRLAKILNTDYKTLWTKTQLCGAKGSPKIGCWNGSPYQPIPVTKAAASEAALQIIEHAEQFPGIAAKPEGFRTYPADGDVNAAHILGYLGPVSNEDLKSNSARSVGLHPTDLVGKAGLEYQYDQYLRGQSGVRRVVVDRTGAVTRTLQDTLPLSGNHLVTSIDSKLQTVVEEQLAAAIARARAGAPGDKRGARKADAGAAIVMDVTSGRIMAMASWPTYNPNIWLEGLSFKQASDLFSEAEGVPALSRAIQGQFAPASTFKMVSLSAAAKAGYDFNAKYNCPASLKIGNRVFTNFESKGAGLISMRDTIALSCDTVWYQIAYDQWVKDGGLSPKRNLNDFFFKAAKGFGFGKQTGVDLPSESSGRLPNREWKESWYAANKNFFCNYETKAIPAQRTPLLIAIAKENCVDGAKIRAGDAVNFAIGQGDTTATPMQMIQMYAAIANGGTIMKPTIGRAILNNKGKVIKEILPQSVGKLPLDKPSLAFMQDALQAVVTEGTARYPFTGFPVAVSAKTGTGEVFGKNLDGSEKDTTSWLVSYAPSEKPKYAVLMMVSQGGYGSLTSGPSVRKIYESIFGVTGSKVDPLRSLFPSGPPSVIPKLTTDGRVLPPIKLKSTAKNGG